MWFQKDSRVLSCALKIRSQTGLEPGIHFKVPFIEGVRIYDVRLRSFDVQSSRILTANQKYVLVDYYTKWKIVDVPLYFKRTGGLANRAEVLLQQKINNALRAEFGERTISEVVTGERVDIINTLRKKANASAALLGVEVVDARIRRIDLPHEVSMSVFQRLMPRAGGCYIGRKVRQKLRKFVRQRPQALVILANAKANAAKRKARVMRAQQTSQ